MSKESEPNCSDALKVVAETQTVINDAKILVGQNIERQRTIYAQLENAELYLGGQERLLRAESIAPQTFLGTMAAQHASSSVILRLATDIKNEADKYVGTLEQMAYDFTASGYAGYQVLSWDVRANKGAELPPPNLAFSLDELMGRVKAIHANIERMVAGAWAAVDNATPDSVRQACHSLRDAVTHLMEFLAPDSEIKKASWYKPAKDSKTGISRRHRITYAVLGKRALTDLPSPETLDLIASALDTYGEIIGDSHKLEEIEPEKAKTIMQQLGTSLLRLLQLRDANMK